MTEETHPIITPGETKVPEIEAKGKVEAIKYVIISVAILCGLLIFGSFIFCCIYPEKTKDIWVIVGPIVSAAVTGMMVFLTGERNKT